MKKTKVDDHSNSYSKPIETPKIPPKPKELPVSSPRGRKPLNKEKDNKKVKSADNTPQPMAEKKKGKKNRELEGLLNMDFGKENPFKVGEKQVRHFRFSIFICFFLIFTFGNVYCSYSSDLP